MINVRLALRRRAPDPTLERPREAQGLVAPWLRVIFAAPYRGVLAGLGVLRIRANHLTAASLGVSVATAVLLAMGRRFLPAMLLLLAGLLDVFDGAVARARGESGPRGAWLDSVIDRAADGAVLSGLFLSLSKQGDGMLASLTLGALVVSLAVSYVRARALAFGVSLKEGFFARAERTVALTIGLAQPGALGPALLALVVLGALTLFQRAWHTRNALRPSSLDGVRP